MDKLIKPIAPFGAIGVVFIVALTLAMAAGLGGAAAFTCAMAILSPRRMIGGSVSLFLVGMGAKLVVDYGYDAIILAVVGEQLKTQSKDKL